MTPPTVDALVSSIRDLVPQLPYKGLQCRDDDWHQAWGQVCAAMDALGDVEWAIRDYRETENIGYLHIYGLLQSLIVAQDAANLLRKHFTGKDLIQWPKSDQYERLQRIRMIRNETIGHPTASEIYENGKRAHRQAGVMIVRMSMSKAGFIYHRHDQRDAVPVHVNIEQAIRDQEKGITEILREITSTLESAVASHHSRFRDAPIKPVWDEFSESRFETFDDLAVQDFREVLNHLDAALADRCGDLDTGTLPLGIQWYRGELKDALNRVEALHKLFGGSRYANDTLRDAWHGLGDEIALFDESSAIR